MNKQKPSISSSLSIEMLTCLVYTCTCNHNCLLFIIIHDLDLQYGEMKEGVVYPGEVRVGLSLDPQAKGCSDVIEDATNCIAVITRDDIMYIINLILSNDVAQTRPVIKMFECKFIVNLLV